MTLEAGLRELLREIVRDEVRAVLAENHKLPVSESGGQVVEYIDDRELAKVIGVSRETLQQWRSRGEGPPYVRVARRAVRYSTADVRAWMAARTARPGR